MEVVSAVASFIAIGQALAASRKAAGFLRRIPHLEEEWKDLLGELDIIAATAEACRLTTTIMAPNLRETGLQRLVREQLEEIKSEMNALSDRCTRESGIGDDKQKRPRKRRLLFLKDEIKGLHERAQRTKTSLLLSVLLLPRPPSFDILQIRHLFEDIVTSKMKEAIPHLLEELSLHTRAPVQQPAKLISEPGQTEASSTLEIGRRSSTTPILETSSDDGPALDPSENAENAEFSSACPVPCFCRCHQSQPVTRRPFPEWFRPLFGSVELTTRLQFWKFKQPCNETSCRGQDPIRTRLDVWFPQWLAKQVLSFQANMPFEVSVGLRPKHRIPFVSPIWYLLDKPEALETWEERRFRDQLCQFGPLDETLDGDSLINHILRDNRFDKLELLMSVWQRLLTRHGPSRRDWFAIQKYRRNTPFLKPTSRHLLEKLSSLGEDGMVIHQTKLHVAIEAGDDLQALILPHRPAIDAINMTGDGPQHLAARLGDVAALQILLIAGVRIDHQNEFGQTALMIAAEGGHVEAVRMLLDHGYNPDVKSCVDRSTAVCFAVNSPVPSSCEVLKLLNAREADMKIMNAAGGSLLHGLAKCTADPQTIEDKVRLLHKGGVDLEHRDSVGRTAIQRALVLDNLPLIRALAELGASLAWLDGYGRTTLHLSASYSSEKTRTYLHSLSLNGININHRSSDGRTAWDTFIATLFDVAHGRPCDEKAARAYEALFRGVRNRDIQQNALELAAVHDAVMAHDTSVAAAVEALAERKVKSGFDILAKTYETVLLLIRGGMWDAAEQVVNKQLESLMTARSLSPWAQPSDIWQLPIDDIQKQGYREWALALQESCLREWRHSEGIIVTPHESDWETLESVDDVDVTQTGTDKP